MLLLKILCFIFLMFASSLPLQAASPLLDNKIVPPLHSADPVSTEAPSSFFEKENIWEEIWGEPSSTQINAFMWTYHLSDLYTSDPLHKPLQSNDLFALTYHGITAGTFLNTQYDRTYFIALSRQVLRKSLRKNWQYNAGYRVGLMQGYGTTWTHDHIGIATPILPIVQLFNGVDWHGAGVEVALTAPFLVSFNFYYRF
jgi:hypothetical protein